ncbi:hypothetical protein H4R33_004242 [Dimargaris cristalligena]|uniref:glucan endo-1,3-beta-D-glucosidase n=1 Tax=Dimargaris cristalligena TaxID=215637 RepID=A0A4P9ZX54_9FUNG|nr:hypothetical protein H4R33_004242 [Dimargaris cristalligena]RKP38256.1 glycoside hydrolase superfamily [Dimargaris cristalligena]|eukprot:RKP38256.1 glycoside hydrolase superfamily [Dimargaris cristalligena]
MKLSSYLSPVTLCVLATFQLAQGCSALHGRSVPAPLPAAVTTTSNAPVASPPVTTDNTPAANPPATTISSYQGIQFHGVTYTPFDSSRQYFTEAQTLEHMKLASQMVKQVRLYSTDGNQIDVIFAALAKLNSNVKVIVGLWLKDTAARYDAEVAKFKELLAKYPGRISGVAVGNEMLHSGKGTREDLIARIQSLRGDSAVVAAKVPVGTFDVDTTWDASLANACDFIGVNIQPDFGTSLPQAVEYAQRFMDNYTGFVQRVAAYRGNKPIIVGEVGHATSDPAQFTQFANALSCKASQISYFYFELVNAGWKTATAGQPDESQFGILDTQNKSKIQGTIACSS